MSWQPAVEPETVAEPGSGPVEMVILPRTADIGGFEVRRVLPFRKRRMVGPFVFLDQMGPAELIHGRALDVRAHPHIGLATVTYLLAGEILHKDSLGTEQEIRPGDVNWMTAGSGIAHSEHSTAAARLAGARLFGLQSWVALPKALEESPASFVHHGREVLPLIRGEGKALRVIAGSFEGATSPVPTSWDTVYVDAQLQPGAKLPFPAAHEERAIYLVDGTVLIGGQSFEGPQMLVLHPRDAPTIQAETAARLFLLGGATMDGPRHIWWNFVSSSKERIEQAKADWRARRFAEVPGEAERIELP